MKSDCIKFGQVAFGRVRASRICHLKAGAGGVATPCAVKSWDLKIFSGIKKSFLTVNELKIEVFHFPLKDSKSTKNLQNFDTKADIMRQIMKLWEAFYFSINMAIWRFDSLPGLLSTQFWQTFIFWIGTALLLLNLECSNYTWM